MTQDNTSAGLLADLVELREFLDGSGSLDGLFFGDAKVGHGRAHMARAQFWWRDEMNRRIDRALSALRQSAAPASEAGEPVAWLHTLHMEGGQTYERLLPHDGRDPDEPSRTAFGIPGRDYSEEYSVTSEPLFSRPSESAEAVKLRKALEAIAAIKVRIVEPWTHETAADVYSTELDRAQNYAKRALAKLDAGGAGDAEHG